MFPSLFAPRSVGDQSSRSASTVVVPVSSPIVSITVTGFVMPARLALK